MKGIPCGFLGLHLIRILIREGPIGVAKEAAKYGDDLVYGFIGPFVGIIITSIPPFNIVNKKSAIYQRGHFQKSVAAIGLKYATFVIEGHKWRKQRTVMNPFFGTTAVQAFDDEIMKITKKSINNVKEGETFDLKHFLNKIAVQVILNVSFGFKTNETDIELSAVFESQRNILQKISDWLKLGSWIALLYPDIIKWKFWQMLYDRPNFFTKTTQTIYQNHSINQNLCNDLKNLKDPEGNTFKPKEIANIMKGIMLAGSETTATSIQWLLYEVYRHPHVLQKLKEELTTVLGDNMDPSFNLIKDLVYLDKVVLENMRLHSPVNIGNRVSVQDDDSLGYLIPKGTQIWFFIHHIFRNCVESPDEFNPDRFNDNNYESLSKTILLGFGTGPHICLGMHLALLEMKIVFCTIIRNCNLTLPNGPIALNIHSPTHVPLKLEAKMNSKVK